ncbi:hypothetical protein [Dictyobacter aurantiacus]|uniref:SprT-like domain-containing protein n=1 Tax=Dictyobacter aurantiacus TaxID=1936993 RepID=A0A401ZEF2_9CHLR|nr:hypothetical protein [Dictyobacter aurantiacus]GCE05203.1 hypothetical protein KDAU_25320 [Dictyobacter aurantiacus]
MIPAVLIEEPASYTRPSDRYQVRGYLQWLWHNYFADIPCVNEVTIAYCYPWKGRLGLIRLSADASMTFIGVNTLLQMSQIPEYVLITTIAHELVHYIHGFGSPLPRRYKHPHANKVVDRELEQRQLGAYLHACNEWIDNYWYSFYDMQRATGWAGIQGIDSFPPRGSKLHET